MIKNEKQYSISKRRIVEANEAIDRINNDPKKTDLRKIVLTTSLEMFRNDIIKEIAAYEKLKKDKKVFLKARQIAELPSLFTEYKIKAGLTQKEFAKKLRMKEQQLQRYEASSFKSVTFKNLVKYFDLLSLEIRIKETRFVKIRRSHRKKKLRA